MEVGPFVGCTRMWAWSWSSREGENNLEAYMEVGLAVGAYMGVGLFAGCTRMWNWSWGLHGSGTTVRLIWRLRARLSLAGGDQAADGREQGSELRAAAAAPAAGRNRAPAQDHAENPRQGQRQRSGRWAREDGKSRWRPERRPGTGGRMGNAAAVRSLFFSDSFPTCSSGHKPLFW